MLLARSLRSVSRCLSTSKSFAILGVETSCDDTAVGVVTSDGRVLSNTIHSQLAVHLKTGGIVPNVAGTLHSENIHCAVSEALQESRLTMNDISYVALTVGPGLAPCLKSGLVYAKHLCKEWRLVCTHSHREQGCVPLVWP